MSPDFKRPDGTIGALGPFTKPEEIEQAMPDLAGIRVILVFPDDEEEIHKFITANTIRAQLPNYWGVDKDGSLKVDRFTHITKRKDRFVGYRAIHYRVKLQEEISDDSNLANGSESLKSWWRGQWEQHLDDSWATKDVEIQVTSMTMYAWQEVHHDLIYKTYEGNLTDDEVSTLDMVNGLVHANEIALNQFHQSLNKRLDAIRRPFRDVSHLRE
jgi:ppGpp synthetase/RelA/SpoT-type nucleotidyltranferase